MFTRLLAGMVLLLLVGFSTHKPAPVAAEQGVAADTFCPGNALVNGDFEQGQDVGWTSVPGYRSRHDIIGRFPAHDGAFSAMLGGEEGIDSMDAIWQAVTIPNHARLAYAWWMHTYETKIFHDYLWVDVLDAQGNSVVDYVDSHGIDGLQVTWQTASVDLSRSAGQDLRLRFSVYNDNYFFSTFFVDSVCLFSAQEGYLPMIGR